MQRGLALALCLVAWGLLSAVRAGLPASPLAAVPLSASPLFERVYSSNNCRDIDPTFSGLLCDNTTEPTSQEKGCTYDALCPQNSSIFWCSWDGSLGRNVWWGLTGTCDCSSHTALHLDAECSPHDTPLSGSFNHSAVKGCTVDYCCSNYGAFCGITTYNDTTKEWSGRVRCASPPGNANFKYPRWEVRLENNTDLTPPAPAPKFKLSGYANSTNMTLTFIFYNTGEGRLVVTNFSSFQASTRYAAEPVVTPPVPFTIPPDSQEIVTVAFFSDYEGTFAFTAPSVPAFPNEQFLVHVEAQAREWEPAKPLIARNATNSTEDRFPTMTFLEPIWLVFWERTTEISAPLFSLDYYDVDYYFAASTDGATFGEPVGLQFREIHASFRPRVAASLTSFMLVFARKLENSNTRLVFSLTEHGGFEWSYPVDITVDDGALISRYDVASDGLGFMVAYVEWIPGTTAATNRNMVAYRKDNNSPWTHKDLDSMVSVSELSWNYPRVVYDRTIGFVHCNTYTDADLYSGVTCAILPNGGSDWNRTYLLEGSSLRVDQVRPGLDLDCNDRGVCVVVVTFTQSSSMSIYYWRFAEGDWSTNYPLSLDPSISTDNSGYFVTVSSDVLEYWTIAFQTLSSSSEWGSDGDIAMSMSFDNAQTFSAALPQLPHAAEDDEYSTPDSFTTDYLEEYPQLASNGKQWLLVYTTNDPAMTGLPGKHRRIQYSFFNFTASRLPRVVIPPTAWPICVPNTTTGDCPYGFEYSDITNMCEAIGECSGDALVAFETCSLYFTHDQLFYCDDNARFKCRPCPTFGTGPTADEPYNCKVLGPCSTNLTYCLATNQACSTRTFQCETCPPGQEPDPTQGVLCRVIGTDCPEGLEVNGLICRNGIWVSNSSVAYFDRILRWAETSITISGNITLNRTTIVVTDGANFYVQGDVLVPIGSSIDLVGSNSTVIEGNLFIMEGGSLSVGLDDQFKPIEIHNCGYFSGTLNVNVNANNLSLINNTHILNAACINGSFSHVNINYGSGVDTTCIDAETEQGTSSLALVFRFNSKCSNGPEPVDIIDDKTNVAIIAGVVGAAALALIVILFILSLVVESLRRKIYPHQFQKRFESSATLQARRSFRAPTRGSQEQLDLVEPAELKRRESVHRTRSQSRLDSHALKAQEAAEAKYIEKVTRYSPHTHEGSVGDDAVELEAV